MWYIEYRHPLRPGEGGIKFVLSKDATFVAGQHLEASSVFEMVSSRKIRLLLTAFDRHAVVGPMKVNAGQPFGNDEVDMAANSVLGLAITSLAMFREHGCEVAVPELWLPASEPVEQAGLISGPLTEAALNRRDEIAWPEGFHDRLMAFCPPAWHVRQVTYNDGFGPKLGCPVDD